MFLVLTVTVGLVMLCIYILGTWRINMEPLIKDEFFYPKEWLDTDPTKGLSTAQVIERKRIKANFDAQSEKRAISERENKKCKLLHSIFPVYLRTLLFITFTIIKFNQVSIIFCFPLFP